jgi:peptidoglycan hydrolase CwlO-like protein
MKWITKFLLVFILILSLAGILSFTSCIFAQTPDERLQQLTDEIQKYESELQRLAAQKNTLSNQIAQYDAQIKLTVLKISQTEEKIALLGGRIEQLQGSLESLTSAFVVRANQTYKMSRFSEPYLLLLSSNNLSDVVSTYHYLKRIQEADRDLLDRLKIARETYIDQKSEQEALQAELERQKVTLAAQRVAKDQLLTQTKNDEKRYQSLLAQAKSEYEAIQAILAGKGQEEKVGHVNEGDKIATIIAGPSCNSSGEHLHFMVVQNGNTLNPFVLAHPVVVVTVIRSLQAGPGYGR